MVTVFKMENNKNGRHLELLLTTPLQASKFSTSQGLYIRVFHDNIPSASISTLKWPSHGLH
jgi:hypothetical protein